jgi:hypothetical protein
VVLSHSFLVSFGSSEKTKKMVLALALVLDFNYSIGMAHLN